MRTQDFIHGTLNSGSVFGQYKDARVIFKGDQAYTDGKTIVIPSLAHDKEMSIEAHLAVLGVE